MSKHLEEIRKTVRNILEQTNYISEEGVNADNEPLDWLIFEYFGAEILKELKYQGDFDPILNKARKVLENNGWEFEDSSEGIW